MPAVPRKTNGFFRQIKRLLFNRFVFMFLLPMLVLFALWCFWIEPNKLLVRHETLTAEELACNSIAKKIRIAHLSDLHVISDAAMLRFQDSVEKTVRCYPDVIFITGDIECPNKAYLKMSFDALLAFLAHTAPTFACLGNHDYVPLDEKQNGAVSMKRQEVVNTILASGITLLDNEKTSVVVNGTPMVIAGIGDYWNSNSIPGNCLDAQDENKHPLTLVLMHNPEAMHLMENFQWDVMFCGHSHGGQFRIPFTDVCPFAPMKNKSFAAKNLYRLSNGKFLNVTSGVGNLHELRLNCFPEIVVMDLVPPHTPKKENRRDERKTQSLN